MLRTEVMHPFIVREHEMIEMYETYLINLDLCPK